MNANKPSDLKEKLLSRFHQGAKASTQEYARELRLRKTEGEQKLNFENGRKRKTTS